LLVYLERESLSMVKWDLI